MNRHLILYQNHSQYVNPTITPNVSYCVNENHVHYLKEHDYSKDYLTFVNKRDWDGQEANMEFNAVYDDGEGDIIADNSSKILYSTDNGNTWINFENMIDWSQIPVGGKVLFKGSNLTATYMGFGGFVGEFYGDIEGNIMSLFYGDDFADKTSFPEYLNNNYISLIEFFYNLGVISAENLILPITTLTSGCYTDMFSGCTNLIKAPKLPATTLAYGCYSGMFSGCTRLTIAPELPATTLADSCYRNMFAGCTSLTTLSELPATTLKFECYAMMFDGCTNVTLEAVVPSSVTPVGETYCNGMYYECSITTPSGQYSSIAYLEYEEMP